MDKQMLDLVIEQMKLAASKIGQGGEWMFKQAVLANYATAAQHALFALGLALAGKFMYQKSQGFFSRAKSSSDKFDEQFVGGVLSVLSAGAAIFAVVAAADALYRFIAPEWSALYDIVNLVKK